MMENAVLSTKPEDAEHIGLVLYTDGGARPNPGFIGSGVYGYSFDTRTTVEKESSIGVEDQKTGKPSRIVATTQGWVDQRRLSSYVKQGARTVNPIDQIQFVISFNDVGTNNYAELFAISKMLDWGIEQGVKSILIFADSEYARKCLLEYAAGWCRNNWLKSNGEPPANVDLIRSTYTALVNFRAGGGNFDIRWVKGHNDAYGNVRADFLATVGVFRSVERDCRVDGNVTSYKKVQAPKIERHPMLSYRRAYFNNNADVYNPLVIYQGDPGSKDEAQGGKRTADASYSVVVLRQPDPMLDMVMRRQFELVPERDALMQLRFDGVYHKEVQHMSNLYERHAFERTTDRSCGISCGVDGRPITVELNPPGLVPRMIDALNLLRNKLETYVMVCGKPELLSEITPKMNLHDITGLFFEQVPTRPGRPDKTVLKKTITNEIKQLQLKIEEPFNGQMEALTPTLAFGLDILPRNNLKRLEDVNPRVLLLTWSETPNSIRYATIIDSDIGVGIWSNFFSDKLFFNAGGNHA